MFSGQNQSLDGFEISVVKNKPFRAGSLEIDVYSRLPPLALRVEDDSFAEFWVCHTLAKPEGTFVTRMAR